MVGPRPTDISSRSSQRWKGREERVEGVTGSVWERENKEAGLLVALLPLLPPPPVQTPYIMSNSKLSEVLFSRSFQFFFCFLELDGWCMRIWYLLHGEIVSFFVFLLFFCFCFFFRVHFLFFVFADCYSSLAAEKDRVLAVQILFPRTLACTTYRLLYCLFRHLDGTDFSLHVFYFQHFFP